MHNLIVDPRAAEQVEELRVFHESKKTGRGSDFLIAIVDCLESIQQNPLSWQYLETADEGTRRAITAYPQAIVLYEIEDNDIIITSVYDSRSDWK